MKKLLLALLGLLIALPGMAFTFEHEGNTLEYTPNSDGTTCALTGGGAAATGAVVIPETVTDSDSGTPYTVTSIAKEVFRSNKVIESVVMPNTITSVGTYCFSSCSALASCQLSESLTEIADYTFYSCKKLTHIRIPEGVTTIGDYAFYSGVLQAITIPASVKKLEILHLVVQPLYIVSVFYRRRLKYSQIHFQMELRVVTRLQSLYSIHQQLRGHFINLQVDTIMHIIRMKL